MSASEQLALLAASMRKVGGIHQTKSPVAQQSESGTAVAGSDPEIPVSDSATGSGLGVDRMAAAAGGDGVSAELLPKKKKARIGSPGSLPVVETMSQDSAGIPAFRQGGAEAEGSRVPSRAKIGNKTLGELGDFAGEIPGEADWNRMAKLEQHDILRSYVAVWGQLGMVIAGHADKVNEQKGRIKELSGLLAKAQGHVQNQGAKLAEKDQEVEKLKAELAAALEEKSKLTENLQQAESRVIASEDATNVLKERVSELQTEIDSRASDAEIIEVYKGSTEYMAALAGAAAEKLHRCWIVAEKLVKTDPNHSYEEFCTKYIEAEGEKIRSGQEPTPYDGPGVIYPSVHAE